MKKRISHVCSLMIVLTIFVNLLAGCSKSDNAESTTSNKGEKASVSKEEKKEKTKVVWWTHQRHDMDFMQEHVEKFVKENEDIEIEYVIQTENYGQNLELSFQSGQAPDIFSTGNAKYNVDREMIAPLDDFLTDEHKERFGDLLYVENSNYVDGKTYSLPNVGNIFRFVYNKDLMKKAGITEVPTTLSELVEYAEKVSEVGKDEGAYGFAINLKSAAGAFSRSIDKIAEASGLQPYDYKTGQYDFGRMKPIILAFKEMYEKGHMFPGVEALDMDPLRSQFAEGKIGSYLSAHWEVGVYNNQFPTEVDWAAAPVPVVEGFEGKGKAGVSKAGCWQGISSQSKVKETAFKVLDYFYSEEVLVGYHNNGLGFSIVPSVMEKVDEPTVKGAKDFLFNTEIDRFWEVAPSSFGWCPSNELKPEGKVYADVFTGVILGATDIDDAIEDLNKRYNASYDKAIEKGKMERIILPDFDASK